LKVIEGFYLAGALTLLIVSVVARASGLIVNDRG